MHHPGSLHVDSKHRDPAHLVRNVQRGDVFANECPFRGGFEGQRLELLLGEATRDAASFDDVAERDGLFTREHHSAPRHTPRRIDPQKRRRRLDQRDASRSPGL